MDQQRRRLVQALAAGGTVSLAGCGGGSSSSGGGTAENPSPMQKAFVEHDAYQCGYCTPGQICSATAMLDAGQAGPGRV